MIQSARMRTFAVSALLLAWLGGQALGAQASAAEARRLGSFIPATAGPWLSEADQVYDAAAIPEGVAVPAEALRSRHLRLLVLRRFVKDGQPDILVAACDMGSAANARAVFLHDEDGREAGVGQGSSYRAGLLIFWKDRYFVAVSTEKETEPTRSLVLGLGRAIAAAIPGGDGRTKGP
jgi:hypothetical protein